MGSITETEKAGKKEKKRTTTKPKQSKKDQGLIIKGIL